MSERRQFMCRNCGHIAAHGFLEKDGDGTRWYKCENCKAPFGVPSREFVEQTKRKAW